MEELKELLFALCAEPGTPGDECAPAKRAARELLNLGETAVDRMGNVVCRLGKRDAKRHILLDAHIDQVGLIVTRVEDAGFLRVDRCGGTDRRVLPGSPVTVFGKETLTGVVCCMPPHLTDGGEDKVEGVDQMAIDVGLTGEEAKALVSPGDRVLVRAPQKRLLGNRIASPALDDRAGCAALIRCAQLLQKEPLNCALTILLSSREETGGQGAETGAFALDPTEAVAVDVSFAAQPGVDPAKCGKLGGGPMIGVAPVLSRPMTDKLVQLAKEKDIPYTLEIMGGETGTNADAIATAKAGVHTAMVSIPLRYMHTPVEVVDVQDVEHVAQLLAAYVKGAE